MPTTKQLKALARDRAYDEKPFKRKKEYNWTPARLNVNTHAQMMWQLGSLDNAAKVFQKLGYTSDAAVLRNMVYNLRDVENHRYHSERTWLESQKK